MKIVKQSIINPEFNVKIDINSGSNVKLVVTESEKKIDSIQLNLEETADNRLALGLVVSETKDSGYILSVIENLEKGKSNLDKLKIVVDKFKETFNKLQPVTGNYLTIAGKIDSKKLDLKKKTIQVYNYNNETKLPENVFECDLKVDKERISELETMLQNVLKKDIVSLTM